MSLILKRIKKLENFKNKNLEFKKFNKCFYMGLSSQMEARLKKIDLLIKKGYAVIDGKRRITDLKILVSP